jgi:O-antigen biosynthesis protein WbqP
MYEKTKRTFDLVSSSLALILLLPLLIVIAVIVKVSSKGPVIHWSDRQGLRNRRFKMAKFRTLDVDAPELATHLINDLEDLETPAGKTLRRFSLDELPQLYNIFKGELSFVGPRPALFNQDDLIALRTENNVHLIMPGLTGWAQICGRDSLSIREKVEHDVYYAEHRSIWFDVKIIWLTIFRVLSASPCDA